MSGLKSHVTTAAVTLVAAAAFFIPGAAEAMDLRPHLVWKGEVWRLLTGHLAHCGLNHLFWDLLMFAVLGGWLELRIGSRNYCLLLILWGSTLGAALLFLLPEHLAAYRGLSGLDSALFAFVAGALAIDLRGRCRLVPALMLLLFVLKSFFELVTGRTIFVADQSMVVVPVAHLAGAILGAVAIAVVSGFSRAGITRSNREPHAA